MQRSGWEDILGQRKRRDLSPKAQRNWKAQGTDRARGQRGAGGVKSERRVNAGQEREFGFHSSLMEALKGSKQGRDLI